VFRRFSVCDLIGEARKDAARDCGIRGRSGIHIQRLGVGDVEELLEELADLTRRVRMDAQHPAFVRPEILPFRPRNTHKNHEVRDAGAEKFGALLLDLPVHAQERRSGSA